MKLIEKRIAFLILSMLSFTACGKSSKSIKYKYSANNGFYAINYDGGPYLYWVKNHKIARLDFHEVAEGDDYLDYDFATIPQDIDVNNIILSNGFTYLVKERDGLFCISPDQVDEEGKTLRYSYPIPNKAASICNIGFFSVRPDIAILNGKELTVWIYDRKEKKHITQKYALEKKYESSFYLGGNTIGLVHGNEIDFMQVDLSDVVAKWTDYIDEFSSLPNHLTLDKQYDAYVGLYDNGWFIDGKTAYLGCIEGNKLRFYNIKRGQFASNPFSGVEFTCTF